MFLSGLRGWLSIIALIMGCAFYPGLSQWIICMDGVYFDQAR